VVCQLAPSRESRKFGNHLERRYEDCVSLFVCLFLVYCPSTPKGYAEDCVRHPTATRPPPSRRVPYISNLQFRVIYTIIFKLHRLFQYHILLLRRDPIRAPVPRLLIIFHRHFDFCGSMDRYVKKTHPNLTRSCLIFTISSNIDERLWCLTYLLYPIIDN
jgi:hypothetical protein